jgi:signal transduction histidine kinase
MCDQIPADLPPLAISEEYLIHVIDHLVENAIKFTEHGKVTLAASQKDHYVELVVSDDGIGIRPAALNWVFDSFRQVDRQKREQQGAGLGLAIVRGLVQTHGGSVTIQSQPDVGTAVTVELLVDETDLH